MRTMKGTEKIRLFKEGTIKICFVAYLKMHTWPSSFFFFFFFLTELYFLLGASLVAQRVKHLPAMWET